MFSRSPDERRRLPARVINYGSAATAAYINGQFNEANRVWNAVGLQIDRGAPTNRAVPAAATNGAGQYAGNHDNPQEVAAMADLVPITPDDTLTVVFVNMSVSNAYATVAQRLNSALGNRFFIFINLGLPLSGSTSPMRCTTLSSTASTTPCRTSSSVSIPLRPQPSVRRVASQSRTCGSDAGSTSKTTRRRSRLLRRQHCELVSAHPADARSRPRRDSPRGRHDGEHARPTVLTAQVPAGGRWHKPARRIRSIRTSRSSSEAPSPPITSGRPRISRSFAAREPPRISISRHSSGGSAPGGGSARSGRPVLARVPAAPC